MGWACRAAQVGRSCHPAWTVISPVQQHLYAVRAGIRLRQPCRCRRARGVQTHGSIPKPMLDKLGIDERLLRLSVGLENAEDLIADLEQAIG